MPTSHGKLPVPRLLLTGARGSTPAAVRPKKKVLLLLFPRPRKTTSSPPRRQLRVTPQLQTLHLPLLIRPLPSQTKVVPRAKSEHLLQTLLTPGYTGPPPQALPTTRSGPLNLAFHPAPTRMSLHLHDHGDACPPTPITPGHIELTQLTGIGTQSVNCGTASSPS